MVDLSKYTITIDCYDDNFIGLCAEYPNIKIIEDTYKAAYDALSSAIGYLAETDPTQEEHY